MYCSMKGVSHEMFSGSIFDILEKTGWEVSVSRIKDGIRSPVLVQYRSRV